MFTSHYPLMAAKIYILAVNVKLIIPTRNYVVKTPTDLTFSRCVTKITENEFLENNVQNFLCTSR